MIVVSRRKWVLLTWVSVSLWFGFLFWHSWSLKSLKILTESSEAEGKLWKEYEIGRSYKLLERKLLSKALKRRILCNFNGQVRKCLYLCEAWDEAFYQILQEVNVVGTRYSLFSFVNILNRFYYSNYVDGLICRILVWNTWKIWHIILNCLVYG